MSFKLFIRRIKRNKLNTVVILISLAAGIACFNLTSTFILRELKTDSFHKDKEKIYALSSDYPFGNTGDKIYLTVNGTGEYMKENFSPVEDFCYVRDATPTKIIAGENEFNDPAITMGVSPNFFKFFSYQLLTSDSDDPVGASNQVVISEELAMKYYGDLDVVGRSMTFVDDSAEIMTISGIFKKPNENSQLDFDIVRRVQTDINACYIKLADNADVTELEYLLKENHSDIPVLFDKDKTFYYLTPLQKVYFVTSREGKCESGRDKADLYIAGIIGLLILIIAMLNTLGLVNNKLQTEAKEDIIRRINGSSKISLVFSFIKETFILVLMAYITGLVLMKIFMSFFTQLTHSSLTISYLLNINTVLIILSTLLLIMLVISGFVLLKLPTLIGINQLKQNKNSNAKLKHFPVFNVIQLSATIVLVIISLTIVKQMKYISNKPIGINKDVIHVQLPAKYGDKSALFKNEFKNCASVSNVSISNSTVFYYWMVLLYYNDGGIEKEYTPAGFSGDEEFVQTLGLELIRGEDFQSGMEVGSGKCFINESFEKIFPNQDLVGKKMPGGDKIIVGVVKDFHYSSLKNPVAPAYVECSNNGSVLLVKPVEGQLTEAKQFIASVWNELIPDYALDIGTVGDRYEMQHSENKNLIKLISSCAIISIFLSMIGLFAVSVQTARSQTKEIGVRKVNGAKVIEILELLNKRFIQWVILALLPAMPIAWFASNRWLEGFAYKTTLSWWIYVASGLLALCCTIITVSIHSWKAARRNPVEALRYE